MTIAAAERTLPHNLEAERSVLGAVLVHNDALELVRAIIDARDFFRDAHRRIFEAMARLAERKVDVDFVTLKDELTRTGELNDVGGPSYVSSLTDGIPRSTNVKHYAAIVREKATLRNVIYAANHVLTEAYEAEEPASSLLAKADTSFLALRTGQQSGLRDMRQSALRVFADLEDRHEHRGRLRGLPTGFQSIDEDTLGWRPGHLIIIAARASIGKSTFLLNTAMATARNGGRVAFFSYEMTREELEDRVFASIAGIDHQRIQSGNLGAMDFGRITNARTEFAELPILISDQRTLSVEGLRAMCRQAMADGPLAAVVVDYIQRMPGSLTRKGATRTEELTHIAQRLHDLSGEMSLPVLTGSQVKRGSGRPHLDDLRDAGTLEETANEVAFLHRSDHRKSGTTEFILAKQRNGPTTTTYLHLDRDTVTFTDAPQAEPEPEPAEKPQRKRRPGQRTFTNTVDETSEDA